MLEQIKTPRLMFTRSARHLDDHDADTELYISFNNSIAHRIPLDRAAILKLASDLINEAARSSDDEKKAAP